MKPMVTRKRPLAGGLNQYAKQYGEQKYTAGHSPVQGVVPITPIQSAATRLPPFGRDVEFAVAAGKSPNVHLFAGVDAWARACSRTRGTALVLPPGDEPEGYRWPRVSAGVFVCAPGQPRELAFRIARAVVSCGTPMAFAVFGDGEALIVRTVAHAAELERAA